MPPNFPSETYIWLEAFLRNAVMGFDTFFYQAQHPYGMPTASTCKI